MIDDLLLLGLGDNFQLLHHVLWLQSVELHRLHYYIWLGLARLLDHLIWLLDLKVKIFWLGQERCIKLHRSTICGGVISAG